MNTKVPKLWSLGPIKYWEHDFGVPIFPFKLLIGSSLLACVKVWLKWLNLPFFSYQVKFLE
jgi:hypothetical protein